MKQVKIILFASCLVSQFVSCQSEKTKLCTYNKDVLNYYIDIATNLGTIHGAPPIPTRKWTINPIIKVFDSPTTEDLEQISEIIDEINGLQNEIVVSLTDGDEFNIQMRFIAKKDFPSIVPGSPKDFLGLNVYDYNTVPNHITNGIVLIDTGYTTKPFRNRVIREELTEILGLSRDDFNSLYPHSIFNNLIETYAEQYELIDKLLIQMHYSSVIKPGMTADQIGKLGCWK